MLRPSRQALQPLYFAVMVLVITMLTGDIASAQRRRSKVKLHSKTLKGKVIAVAPQAIQVQDEKEGNVWVIAPVAASQIEFIGEAKKNWVDKGMIVRVTATFDKKGIAAEPVDLVQVFTPRDDDAIGSAFQGEGKPDRDQPNEYLIAGVVRRIAEGKVAVSTGKKQFTFEIAADAKVEVELLNVLDWIQPGDKVHSKLKYVNPGEGIIETASVESKTMLVGVEKKSKRRRRSRRSKKAELEAEQAAAENAEKVDGETPATEDTSGASAEAAATAADSGNDSESVDEEKAAESTASKDDRSRK